MLVDIDERKREQYDFMDVKHGQKDSENTIERTEMKFLRMMHRLSKELNGDNGGAVNSPD